MHISTRQSSRGSVEAVVQDLFDESSDIGVLGVMTFEEEMLLWGTSSVRAAAKRPEHSRKVRLTQHFSRDFNLKMHIPVYIQAYHEFKVV